MGGGCAPAGDDKRPGLAARVLGARAGAQRDDANDAAEFPSDAKFGPGFTWWIPGPCGRSAQGSCGADAVDGGPEGGCPERACPYQPDLVAARSAASRGPPASSP